MGHRGPEKAENTGEPSSSPYVIYSCKIEGGKFYPKFSAGSLERLTGYKVEEVLGDPEWWPSHLHPEEKNRILAGFISAMKKNSHTHEYRIRHKNGSYRWICDKLKVMHDNSGAPVEIVGSWLDITESKT